MVHGVYTTGPRQEAEVRSPERRNSTLRFHLPKSAVVGGSDDDARQHHLDANRVDDTLHGGNDRLTTSIGESEDVDRSLPQVPVLGLRTEKLRHIEAGCEVAAFRANDTNPIFIGLIQKSEGVRHLKHHLRAEGILFSRVVDDDFQHVSVHFSSDLSYRSLCRAHVAFSSDELKTSRSDVCNIPTAANIQRTRNRSELVRALLLDCASFLGVAPRRHRKGDT